MTNIEAAKVLQNNEFWIGQLSKWINFIKDLVQS